MTATVSPIALRWSASPTQKARHAVQRSVTALLDELAPERPPKREVLLPGQVEQRRTPTGCVLQAERAAVSVSWHADAGSGAEFGELQIILWRGVVARRSGPASPNGGTIVAEYGFRPAGPSTEYGLWQAIDGTLCDSHALAVKCLALLDAQVGVSA